MKKRLLTPRAIFLSGKVGETRSKEWAFDLGEFRKSTNTGGHDFVLYGAQKP
ncbi:MAG: hypothetical protein V7661_18525 [Sulfitobacter sp.]|jgi:hypothetical protein